MAVELDVHPVFLSPGEGEVVTERPERTVRLLFSHELLDVTWTRYETGERGPDPHVHRQHADAFYVLEEALTFELGPDLQRTLASAGTFVAVPPNVIHSFRNEGSARTCFLNFHAPSGGFADALRRITAGFDSFDPPADGGRSAAEATISHPGEGERFERELRVLSIKADLPQLSANELVFERGWEGVEPHTHDDHVDSFFVLDGNVEFIAGGSTRRAGPGTFVADPPGAQHGFRIADTARIALLNVHAPDAGFAERIRRG
jgi:quercetin dioxygenase-like cupin family protein